MSGRTQSRGMSLHSLGKGLVIAAAICAAWIIWSESRERGWIPGLAVPKADRVDQQSKRGAVSARAPVSIPPLVADLSNETDSNARRQALLKLSSIGPPAAEAIDAIRERLKDENEGVRYAAVLAMSRVSQDLEICLPELRGMLDDPNSGVRDVAADSLAAIGRPVTGLAIDLAQSESPAQRSRALLILRRIVCPETFPEVSAAVESLCQDPDPEIRTAALVAFVDWGLIDQAGIRYLLRSDHIVPSVAPKNYPSRNSREIALDAIAWLGPEAAEFVPDLVGMLEAYPELEITVNRIQDGRQVPYRTLSPGVGPILRTLSSLQSVARPAIPYLLGRRKECRAIVSTLFDIVEDPEIIESLLEGSLEDSQFYVPLRASRLLAQFDLPEARRRMLLSIAKLADPSKPIDYAEQQFLRVLLHGMGRDASEAVPLLMSLLSDRPGAAGAATELLGEIGPDAAPAVPRLIEILEHARVNGKCNEHFGTFDALGKIGPAAKSAVPLLLAIIGEPRTADLPKIGLISPIIYYYECAISALGKIAIDSPEVLSAIRRQLKTESALERAVAMHALARVTNDSTHVLIEIVEMLKNDGIGYVRSHAAMAIASMPGDREQAVAPLTDALGDRDPNVRRAVATVLGAIGPAAKSALPSLHYALLEARCGIPRSPSEIPNVPKSSIVLVRDQKELPPLPLVQSLLKAIAEIERAE